MKKAIICVVVSICFSFFGCFLENIGQNDENDNDDVTETISHTVTLAGQNHHYTNNCSKCHGATNVTCDSCHAGSSSCKDCH